MRYTPGIATLLAAVTLAGCKDIVAPLPTGAVQLVPPQHFAAWWSMVEQCAGRTRPIGQVTWYSVEGTEFLDSEGQRVIGLYRNGPDQVVRPSERLKEGRLVRHETLHAILDSHSDIL